MINLPNLTHIGDALGWAVLHSLWQGALAALLVWGVRALTRESAADTRYIFGTLSLSALFAAFIGTFIYYFNTAITLEPIASIPLPNVNTETATGLSAVTGNPLLQITNHTNMIGGIWALCFTILAVRYLTAFRLTYKLRTSGLSPLPVQGPSNWQERFAELADQSGVNSKVRGFISEHVASPVTFGFFKPIVLVPAWFFTGMSAEQCEAVLLHELAHIRRHDFLTNIFQIIIKTVFFYHPAVQYICKNINVDREHACDDFAVNLTQNPESLATALGMIRIKAARNAGVFTLAADGPDAPIMHRLKRLMGTPTQARTSGTARGFAATSMLVIASGLVFGLGATQSQAHPVSEQLAGAKTTLKIAGDGYKVVGNSYFLKGKNGYLPAVQMKDGYNYDFEVKRGRGYAIITAPDGSTQIDKGDRSEKTGNPVQSPSGYTMSTLEIDEQSFTTKTDLEKNQTFIKIADNWHDLDNSDLDALIPTVPATPATPVTAPTAPLAPLAPTAPLSQYGKTTDQNQNEHDTAWAREGEKQQRKMAERQAKWPRQAEARERKWAAEAQERQRDMDALQRKWAQDAAERERKWGKKSIAHQRKYAQEHQEVMTEHAETHREYTQEWAEEQRELTAEYHENVRERAQEQREYAMEQAQERAQEQRERAIERAHERVEIAAAKRERKLVEMQRQRDEQQHQRDEQQHLRDEHQQARDEEHRKKDMKRQMKFEKLRAHILPLLRDDGHIKSIKSKVVIDMTDDMMTLNGTLMSEQARDTYCKIISKYVESDGDKTRVIFKPGYMHISSQGRDGHSNYSYTHTQ